jgi:hypothetical protein
LAAIGGFCVNAQAQQSNTPTVKETFESAFAKARQECTALWLDHAFDPLRSKLPLVEDKPTFSMLTNNEKLRTKDKPVADLAITTLEKCRSLYAPVLAIRASISLDHSRCFARASEMGRGPVFKRSSVRWP